MHMFSNKASPFSSSMADIDLMLSTLFRGLGFPILCYPVMAFNRVRTGIRLRTDRHLSVPRSGQFLNMVRLSRVGPTSVKYPRNPGQIQESLKTDWVFITSNMDVTGRVLKL